MNIGVLGTILNPQKEMTDKDWSELKEAFVEFFCQKRANEYVRHVINLGEPDK